MNWGSLRRFNHNEENDSLGGFQRPRDAHTCRLLPLLLTQTNCHPPIHPPINNLAISLWADTENSLNIGTCSVLPMYIRGAWFYVQKRRGELIRAWTSMRSHHVCMERKFSGNDSFGKHRNPKQSSRLRMPLSSRWERTFRRKASLMWILMPCGRSHVAGKRTVASSVLQWAVEEGGQVKLPSAVTVTDCEIGSEMRLLWAVDCFIQAEDSVIIMAWRGVTSLHLQARLMEVMSDFQSPNQR